MPPTEDAHGEQVAHTVDGQKAEALGSGLNATCTLRLLDNHSPAKPTGPSLEP